MVWVVIAIGVSVVIGLPIVVWLWGSRLPKSHSVEKSVTVLLPPAAVWVIVTDFTLEPKWNSSIKSSERLPDQNGHEVWRVVDRTGGKLPLETLESVPGKRLIRRIADTKLPYGGVWTITLAPDESGIRVSVREDGEVYNPFFRFISHFFMKKDATISRYLAGLVEYVKGRASERTT